MDGANAVAARTADIAASGMSLALEQPLTVGQSGRIDFTMYFDGTSHALTVKAKVSYCIFSGGDFKTGFQFVNLDLTAMSTISKYLR